MARLLSCPHCHAEFAFEDWAKAATCPACGKRLSFFEASAQAAPPDAGGNGAAPAASPGSDTFAASTAPTTSGAPLNTGTPQPGGPPVVAAPAVSPGPLAQTASEVWDPLPDVRPALSVAPANESTSLDDTPAQSAGEVSVAGAGNADVVCDAGDAGGFGGSGGTLGSSDADRESATPAELWTWSAPGDESPSVDDAWLFAGAAPAQSSAQPPLAEASASAPAAESAVAPASYAFATPAAGGHIYTLGGKALQWSRGWTVLLVVWAIVGVALVATRVDMGHLTVMTPGETAAIAAVRQIRLPTGAPTETVLRYAATHDLNLEGHIVQIKPNAAQMWYAFDRSWEHRIYVYYELPGVSLMGTNVDLSWSVTNGVVTAGAATRVALAKAAQTMAHPPSPNSVRPIPGIIPSLPPDLQ